MTTNTDLNARGTLEDVVSHLEAYDFQLPCFEKWRELRLMVNFGEPAPERPANLLDRTPDELLAWARDVGIHSAIRHKPNPYASAMHSLRDPIDRELKAQIENNVTDIIEHLRSPFDEAADGLREAIGQGVKAKDTRETLFRSPEPVREAWLATHAHAATLDDLLTLRQLLSTVIGVRPTIQDRRRKSFFESGSADSGISWVAAITRPGSGASLAAYNDEAPWERWIEIAPHLELVDPATLPEHTAEDLAALRAQAQAANEMPDPATTGPRML